GKRNFMESPHGLRQIKPRRMRGACSGAGAHRYIVRCSLGQYQSGAVLWPGKVANDAAVCAVCRRLRRVFFESAPGWTKREHRKPSPTLLYISLLLADSALG